MTFLATSEVTHDTELWHNSGIRKTRSFLDLSVSVVTTLLEHTCTGHQKHLRMALCKTKGSVYSTPYCGKVLICIRQPGYDLPHVVRVSSRVGNNRRCSYNAIEHRPERKLVTCPPQP